MAPVDRAHAAPDTALPSTNALAVLALIGVTPMTAYTLAENTTRTMRFVWSASRRLLLGEPQRLAARGLVEAIAAEPGSRAEHRWRITPAGRATLRRWLRTPVAPTQINSEIALRLIFADVSDRQTLLRQIATRREQLLADLDTGLAVIDGYLADGGPFPERLHITAATSRYIADLLIAEYDSLTWLEQEVGHWPDTRTAHRGEHRHRIVAQLRELRARLEASPLHDDTRGNDARGDDARR